MNTDVDTMTPAEIRAKYADLIKAPLKSTRLAVWCVFHRRKEVEHGPLIMVRMTPGFDDLMREGLGFNDNDPGPHLPSWPEGLYFGNHGAWGVTQLDRLPALVEFITERKSIKKLRVRDVVDRAGCAHKRCARERDSVISQSPGLPGQSSR